MLTSTHRYSDERPDVAMLAQGFQLLRPLMSGENSPGRSANQLEPWNVGEVSRVQCPQRRVLDDRAGGDGDIDAAIARPIEPAINVGGECGFGGAEGACRSRGHERVL